MSVCGVSVALNVSGVPEQSVFVSTVTVCAVVSSMA